jgi:thiol-disulfide isomerase/thioredoxin
MRARFWGLMLLALCLPPLAPAQTAGVGAPAPDYLGEDRDGASVRVSERRGRIVVVNFWASWCAPCIEEMPLLEALQQKLGKAVIDVVSVNWGETAQRYREVVQQAGAVQMTMTHDRNGDIGRAYGVASIPRLFVVGPDGLVSYQGTGFSDAQRDGLLDELNRLLAQPASVVPAER